MAKTTKAAESKVTTKKTSAKVAKKSKSPGVETNLVRRVTTRAKNPQIEIFKSGDTVNVFVKVREGEKERIQVYKGVVTKVQGSGSSKSFTVRKISAGVGVERTFPFNSPAVDKVEVLNVGKVRRSRLFYLRQLEGKAAKIDSDLVIRGTGDVESTAPATES